MCVLKPRALLCLILAGLVAQAGPVQLAHAQNDDLDRLFDDEPDDEPPGTFQAPPPPPPPPAGTDFGNQNPGGFPSDDFNGGSGGGGFGGDTSGSRRNFPTPQGSTRGGGSGNARALRPSATGKADKNKPPLSEANIEDITNENYPDLIESFDYPNAEITDVIKAMGQLTGKNFIIDPSVRGKISIIAPSQITVAEAWKAFLAALAINQFTVVPYGKFLKVMSTRNAQRNSIETYSGKYYPNSDILITRIVHLKHTSAEEINKRLRMLPSKDGEMTPYEPTNSLIITDFGSNIERIMKVINEIDRPGFEEQLAVVPIRYAKAKELADLINQIINKEPSRGGGATPGAPGFGAGVPRFPRGRGGQPGSGAPEELSLVAPDERTNAIIVVGNKAGIQKVRDLVKKLDYKLDPAEAGGVFVYYVKYGEAEKIAQTLQGIASGGTAGGGGASPGGALGGANRFGGGASASPLNAQSIFGGDVKIGFDKQTNSLVITASQQDYQQVLTILAKLDIPRDQVFIEAIVMELNSQKTKNWNPNYYGFAGDAQGIGRTGFVTSPIAEILTPAGDSGLVLGFGGGSKFKLKLAQGGEIEIPNLLSFIKLVQQNTESNILSTPNVMVSDNEQATIEVGDKVPVALESTTTTTGTRQAPRTEDASIKMVLTPFIRPDSDVVRLKIDEITVAQVSKNQVRAKDLADSTLSLAKRQIKTNISLNNGDTAVLGGLIRDEESVDEKKIPILGDIPILGWLFKSRNTGTNKINLVVFLTPKIIRNVDDSQKNLSNRLGKRIDWIKKNFDGRDPYGKTVDEFPRAAKKNNSDEIDEPVSAKTNRRR